jgi:hypothetical protein
MQEESTPAVETNANDSDMKLHSSGKPIKKVPIEIAIDNSKEKIGFLHYLFMAIWLGWPSFYLLLMLTFPLLWLYARPLLWAIVAMLTASAIYPIDTRKQPKWAMDFGALVMK